MDWLLTVPLLLIEILLVNDAYRYMDIGFRFSSHDCVRLLRRTCCHWRLDSTLGLLVRLHVLLFVHRLRAPRRPCSCHCQRSRPSDRIEDWHCASNDRDQLVHLPNRVLVPDAWLLSSEGSCVHPVGILRLRCHFQMRRGLGDLSDLLCQIQQAILVAMSQPLHPFAKLALSF